MSSLRWSLFTVLNFILFLLFSPSYALHFFLDGTTPKCFYEELPKDTLVVGTWTFFHFPLKYPAEHPPEAVSVSVSPSFSSSMDALAAL